MYGALDRWISMGEKNRSNLFNSTKLNFIAFEYGKGCEKKKKYYKTFCMRNAIEVCINITEKDINHFKPFYCVCRIKKNE